MMKPRNTGKSFCVKSPIDIGWDILVGGISAGVGACAGGKAVTSVAETIRGCIVLPNC